MKLKKTPSSKTPEAAEAPPSTGFSATPKKTAAARSQGPALKKGRIRAKTPQQRVAEALAAENLPPTVAVEVPLSQTRASAQLWGDQLAVKSEQSAKPVLRTLPARKAELWSVELGVTIPTILFEGDEPSASSAASPGHQYALGNAPAVGEAETAEDELPEAYGTGRLLLIARDPHCLYAQWDLTLEQQQRYNGLSRDQHLVLRVFASAGPVEPVSELHVHSESRHWFVHVDRAGSVYRAELGYYQNGGQWHQIAASELVSSPSESSSEDRNVQFATITFEAPSVDSSGQSESSVPITGPPSDRAPSAKHELAADCPPGAMAGAPLLTWQPESFAQVTAGHEGEGNLDAPSWVAQRPEDSKRSPLLKPRAVTRVRTFREPARGPAPDWTQAQEHALEELIYAALVKNEWLGSAEIEDLLRRKARLVMPSQGAFPAGFASDRPTGMEGLEKITGPGTEMEVTSPSGGDTGPDKRFWLTINAELIIYGATEPDAEVNLGGRRIQLRPDGTFSCRFSLPDGKYELPIVATATHGEQRAAKLDFQRATHFQGEVGMYPHDPDLGIPSQQKRGQAP